MEAVKNMTDFLNAQLLLKDNRSNKLELNLKMLLNKEAFCEVIKENVKKGKTDATVNTTNI